MKNVLSALAVFSVYATSVGCATERVMGLPGIVILADDVANRICGPAS